MVVVVREFSYFTFIELRYEPVALDVWNLVRWYIAKIPMKHLLQV